MMPSFESRGSEGGASGCGRSLHDDRQDGGPSHSCHHIALTGRLRVLPVTQEALLVLRQNRRCAFFAQTLNAWVLMRYDVAVLELKEHRK